jgi:hypothetical protein
MAAVHYSISILLAVTTAGSGSGCLACSGSFRWVNACARE